MPGRLPKQEIEELLEQLKEHMPQVQEAAGHDAQAGPLHSPVADEGPEELISKLIGAAHKSPAAKAQHAFPSAAAQLKLGHAHGALPAAAALEKAHQAMPQAGAGEKAHLQSALGAEDLLKQLAAMLRPAGR